MNASPTDLRTKLRIFRAEYGAHREAEGRALEGEELRSLPYLRSGPVAKQWEVRARSFEALVARVIRPLAREAGRPLRVLDVGAGNGWLSYRMALHGHRPVALDVRDDDVDGLGAASGFFADPAGRFHRLVASFDALPLADGAFDLVVFNASIHYALELEPVLREGARVVGAGGRLVILDSPFYAREEDGAAMVEEKRREAPARFGVRAEALTALPFIEFLTRERLGAASRPLGLAWRRHRVRYPLWYEARPLTARLRGRRPPSRFDLWESGIG